MIRSLLAAICNRTRKLTIGASFLLAAASSVQAQTNNAVARPMPSSGTVTIGTPTTLAPTPATPTPTSASNPIFDPMVVPASGCCGSSIGSTIGGGGAGCGACGGYGRGPIGCTPGQRCPNTDCSSHSICGHLFGNVCNEICCPDPCYEPRFIPEANAAFFQDGPRPVTQTRIRWDAGFDQRFPDTAEFYWAQIGLKGPKVNVQSLRYNDLSLYNEVAAGGFSFFISLPYRTVQPDINGGTSGFGDMFVGTKTVLLDRELLLLTFQFTTFIPTGNFTTGVGTGHVSLEPALLSALKISPTTYLQTELAEWIPVGGTPGFASSVFHFHFSLNQNLLHCGNCFNIIGTAELNGYCFNGAFTDFPGGGVLGAGGLTFMSAGPGIRFHWCDHFDVGFGAAFGFGNQNGPGQLYRTEIRVRF